MHPLDQDHSSRWRHDEQRDRALRTGQSPPPEAAEFGFARGMLVCIASLLLIGGGLTGLLLQLYLAGGLLALLGAMLIRLALLP